MRAPAGHPWLREFRQRIEADRRAAANSQSITDGGSCKIEAGSLPCQAVTRGQFSAEAVGEHCPAASRHEVECPVGPTPWRGVDRWNNLESDDGEPEFEKLGGDIAELPAGEWRELAEAA
jgi:hypothetical protein